LLKSFIKDSFSYSIPSFFSKGISILLIPLYTRFLSPADYGLFDLFLVFMNIVNLTIAFEITQGVARFYIIENNISDKILYASTAFWFAMTSYLIFTTSCIFFSSSLSFFILGSRDFHDIFEIGVVYIFVNGLLQLVQNQFRWQMLSFNFMINSMLHVLFTSIISVVSIYYFNLGIKGLFLGLLAGALIPLIIGYYQLRKTFIFSFDFKKLYSLLKFTSPLVPASVSVWAISYFDRIIIQYFYGLDDVGIYGIGFRISSSILLLLVGFQTALTPLIYKYYEDKNTPSQIALLFKAFLFFIFLSCLVLISILPIGLKYFISSQFLESEKVIVFLVPSVILSQLYIFFPGMSIRAKTKIILYINLFGSLFNVLLNIFLVQHLSYVGASIASLISQFCIFLTFIIFSQKFYFVPHHWKKIISLTIIFFILYFFISFFSSSLDNLLFVKGLIILLFIYFSFCGYYFNKNEIQRFKIFLNI
jgi:O-antigen/teichoic acid export membrane protein